MMTSGTRANWEAQKDSTDDRMVYQWLIDMCSREKRLDALENLSKKRHDIEDLGFLIYHSYGCLAALLQEITDIFVPVMSENLTAEQAHRACLALSLIQNVASHPETKIHLLRNELMSYIVPLLHCASLERPIEYLRLAILAVIGSLVDNPIDEVVTFLVTNEIYVIILRYVETGSELCKTVSAFILFHLLNHEIGLAFVCNELDRFNHLNLTLAKIINQLKMEPSDRILKNIVRCYERLADNPDARTALTTTLPTELRDSTFTECLKQDENTKDCLTDLIKKIEYSDDAVQNIQPV